MAVRGTTDTDTVQTDAPGAAAAQAANRAPGLDNITGMNLFGVMSMLGAGAALGQDVEKYIETLKTWFTRDPANTSAPKIEVKRLAEPQGAHVVVCGNFAIIMLFDALLARDTTNFEPASNNTSRAYQAMEAQFGANTYRMLNSVLVLPGDYDRVQNMAFQIGVTMQIANNPQLRDSNVSIMKGYEYVIDPDTASARQFVMDNSPHAVQPRGDIGFMIYARPPRRAGDLYSVASDESKPIAAVLAYTDILQDESTGKFSSIVHISNITSRIPLPGITELSIAAAADQFIGARRWMQPFCTFQRTKPNLGNLVVDPADPKKLWFFQDQVTFDRHYQDIMLPYTLMAIDVAEGQWRIPGLAVYGWSSAENFAKVYDRIQTFFGGGIPLDRNRVPFVIRWTNYNGVYGDPASGRLTDSREIDYLNLVAQHQGAQDENTKTLLRQLDPITRAKLISEKVTGFRSLHRTPVSVLDGVLLGTLATTAMGALQITSTTRQNRMNNTDWMKSTAEGYQSQSYNIMRPDTRGAWNFGQNYSV
jgi:hypothetical protein